MTIGRRDWLSRYFISGAAIMAVIKGDKVQAQSPGGYGGSMLKVISLNLPSNDEVVVVGDNVTHVIDNGNDRSVFLTSGLSIIVVNSLIDIRTALSR